MAEQIIINRENWQLIADPAAGVLFWRHIDSGAEFKLSSSPSDPEDIARMQDLEGIGGGGGGTELLSELDIDDSKNWGGHDITGLGTLSLNDIVFSDGLGPIQFPAHHTNYQNGLDNKEVARYTCQSGVYIEVSRLETNFLGGGTDPDFEVELYDESDQSVIVSTSDRVTPNNGSRIGRSTNGATVTLRVTNQTGQGQRASITGSATRRWS